MESEGECETRKTSEKSGVGASGAPQPRTEKDPWAEENVKTRSSSSNVNQPHGKPCLFLVKLLNAIMNCFMCDILKYNFLKSFSHLLNGVWAVVCIHFPK
jgi:hypothetical protein